MRPRNKVITNRDKEVISTLMVDYGTIGFSISPMRVTEAGYEFTVYTRKQKKPKVKRERPKRVDRDE